MTTKTFSENNIIEAIFNPTGGDVDELIESCTSDADLAREVLGYLKLAEGLRSLHDRSGHPPLLDDLLARYTSARETMNAGDQQLARLYLCVSEDARRDLASLEKFRASLSSADPEVLKSQQEPLESPTGRTTSNQPPARLRILRGSSAGDPKRTVASPHPLWKRQHPADKTEPYSEVFFAMAAADPEVSVARKLRSQGGDWTLSLFVDRDDANDGYVVLDVSSERRGAFDGRTVSLEVGGKQLLSSTVDGDKAEGPVDLTGVALEAVWRLQIE